MSLSGDVIGVYVGRQLHELDQIQIGVDPGENQPGLLQAVAIGVVELIAMTVPLLDMFAAIGSRDHTAGHESRWS